MNTNPENSPSRGLARLVPSIAASDGAGVKLRRSLGSTQNLRLDPFLMLDEFGTENPDDYIAGFPPHPHRGFETVTYMIDGRMQHRDHLGNVGDLGPGGVQWMRAARGVIHSEMPQQDHGRMRGFQLWINLPAAEKMTPAGYRDIPPEQIPEVSLPGGGRLKLIAGSVTIGNQPIDGPINGAAAKRSTDPLFLDFALPAAGEFTQTITRGHNAFLYVYEGAVTVRSAGGGQALPLQTVGVLDTQGDAVRLAAGPAGARLILLAAKPIGEPIVQQGPFVMNTREEIETAIRDYQAGRLTA
ncbi:MAG TPA: pirin family protein [Steroidobacteraceae bacterium]|nr:pirin family protein [Steroidobacteraceae bacterium]